MLLFFVKPIRCDFKPFDEACGKGQAGSSKFSWVQTKCAVRCDTELVISLCVFVCMCV